MQRVLAIAKKELLHLRRDPVLVGVQLLWPVILLLTFGVVVSVTVRGVPFAARDLDGTAASREAIRALQSTEYFAPIEAEEDPRAALEDGRALVTVEVPAGFARGRGDDELQVVLDGSDTASARGAEAYLERFAAHVARGPRHEPRPEPRPEPRRGAATVSAFTATWFNPERRDALFFVPGLMAVLILVCPAVICGLALVRESEQGTFTSLAATPVSDGELLAGRVGPYFVQACATSAVVLAFGCAIFDVPVNGSLAAVVAGTLLAVITAVALGAAVSAAASTQDSAWSLLNLWLILPTAALSGVIYPLGGMPEAAKVLSLLLPSRHYVDLMRGTLLQGAGFTDALPQLTALAAFASLASALALTVSSRARSSSR